MFEYILLDLDDTILDFQWAENQAITRTLTAFDIEPTTLTTVLFETPSHCYTHHFF